MCYPYGSYNADTLSILNNLGCLIGLTSKPGFVSNDYKRLELCRWDTNDFPRVR